MRKNNEVAELRIHNTAPRLLDNSQATRVFGPNMGLR